MPDVKPCEVSGSTLPQCKTSGLPHCVMQTMQPIMLSVTNKLFTLSVIMLNVIMLCVTMLRVVAPKVIAIWILSIIATHYTIRYRQKNCGITNLSNTCWFLKKRNFHLVTAFATNTCLSLLQSCKYFIQYWFRSISDTCSCETLSNLSKTRY
jgi:hypothetical protein